MAQLKYYDKKLEESLHIVKNDIANKTGKKPTNTQLLGLLVNTYIEQPPKMKRKPKRKEFILKW